ncbi:Uu.00g029710.m01.CDS01 [Anthostomella pinea]|uniref:Uu.00g029710.m01.CDS01 n=1 Tax=Anthostomella pinea TaxID=933095 RepID=A0AAI8YD18_9PEZI|nr:Uu.00g029710.m01.CDS01 [Anthostomella pinea]
MTTQKIAIAVIGTLDTKLPEYLYLRSQILQREPSIDVILIDAGRSQVAHEAITIPQAEVLKASGYQNGDDSLQSLPRGEVIKTMIKGAISVTKELRDNGKIQGIIGLGGSGGTSIAAAVMRELPLTFPKLIVSTVASSDTSSYVGETDITMMYSVVDIAGLNEVLKAVIDNAAAAIVGMAQVYAARTLQGRTGRERKGIGITMFGVTTQVVDVARRWLDGQGFEVYVFHATGAGGRAMERLVREGRLDAVLDLTTTELADELVGGVFSAGEHRLTAAARVGIPQIVSVGALDMVNFGPKDTVPAQFQDRNLFEHNPSVTLMRTTPQECEELGNRLARRLWENCADPEVIEVWLPLKGISAIAVKGQAFYDEDADRALFAAIKKELEGSGIKTVEVDTDINDPTWSEDIARRLTNLLDVESRTLKGTT